MKKCYCLGDSNTFGYDPRSPLGDRYPETYCETLGSLLSWEVCNDGFNGRTIADAVFSWDLLSRNLKREQPDLLLILLGSNDILMDSLTDPKAIAARMDALLKKLRKDFKELPILLLSPPKIRISGIFGELPGILAPHYQSLAEKYGTDFLNLSSFSLELSYDGVHLSEEGHRQLGRILYLHLR